MGSTHDGGTYGSSGKVAMGPTVQGAEAHGLMSKSNTISWSISGRKGGDAHSRGPSEEKGTPSQWPDSQAFMPPIRLENMAGGWLFAQGGRSYTCLISWARPPPDGASQVVRKFGDRTPKKARSPAAALFERWRWLSGWLSGD